MLQSNSDNRELFFPKALERYLEELLHERFEIFPYEAVSGLPAFIGHSYTLFRTEIFGRSVIIVANIESSATPAEIAKHVDIVRNATNSMVVFATNSLSAYNRSRLIAQGVPFIVPTNQLYMPELMIDLREHFRAPQRRQTSSLSPTAQAVLFLHMLRPDETASSSPSDLAKRLNYSAMSVGRAFKELVALGLAESVKHGKERHIQFKTESRQLLDNATPYLRSPVRALKFVQGDAPSALLKLAGEAALAQLTDLAPPRLPTFAVAASEWKAFSHEYGLTETNQEEAEFTIETWSYDPKTLSDTSVVDVLSLYAQFRGHRNERVAMAADQVMKNLPW